MRSLPSPRGPDTDPPTGGLRDESGTLPGIDAPQVDEPLVDEDLHLALFGLHRRWRGAIVGHLALLEITSSIPNRRYAEGIRRLGFDGEATVFFDEHVTADAVHEAIAAVDLAGGLARQDPALGADIVSGARALNHLDQRWACHVLERWADGRTSLLRELTAYDPEAGADPVLAPG